MEITMDEFMKLKLVIGKIIEIERMPESEKLFKVKVNAGNKVSQVIAGGAEYYEPDDLKGKLVVLLTNLEPKVIRGVKSEGMMLAADNGQKPVWLTVEEEVPLGTKVR